MCIQKLTGSQLNQLHMTKQKIDKKCEFFCCGNIGQIWRENSIYVNGA